MATDSAVDTRHLSPLLATAILAMPLLFIWLLLRRDYASSTRRAAFIYLAANVLPYLIAILAAIFGVI